MDLVKYLVYQYTNLNIPAINCIMRQRIQYYLTITLNFATLTVAALMLIDRMSCCFNPIQYYIYTVKQYSTVLAQHCFKPWLRTETFSVMQKTQSIKRCMDHRQSLLTKYSNHSDSLMKHQQQTNLAFKQHHMYRLHEPRHLSTCTFDCYRTFSLIASY